MTNNVNNPNHYNQHSIECIEFSRYLNGNLCQAFQYIWRCYDKGYLIEDLKKAIWLLKDFSKNNIVCKSEVGNLIFDYLCTDFNFKSQNIYRCLLNILIIEKNSIFYKDLIKKTITLIESEIKTIEAKNE